MRTIKWIHLLGWILLCLFVGGVLGSLFTTPSIPTWYVTLVKPVYQPPNWLFGPVWTILYVLMGISAFIVWSSSAQKNIKNAALLVFLVQLGLNALWSPIFFALHWLFLAFAEIVVLWVAILITILQFNKISKAASILLLPYFLWVSFASILNLHIWLLNR
jgi:translocator protein